MDNIFINKITNQKDGSVDLDYSIKFSDNSSTIYGSGHFTSEEAAEAFKNNNTNDFLNGFKNLVTSKLMVDITQLNQLQQQTQGGTK